MINNNAFKRVFYKSRVNRFKTLISWMIIVGILASMAYFLKYAYVEYAVSRAHIVLSYPEIAQSRYPDGSRFTYYDFISEDNLEQALSIMKEKGQYVNLTVDDIRDNFYIYSYVDGSAGDFVSSARSEGNDFSYVANEFKITFVQPHDYKAENIMDIIFGKDLSSEFLNVLVEVNHNKIAELSGGTAAFKLISEPLDTSNYDYGETVNIYKTKISNIITYLKQLEKVQPTFVSVMHNLTLSDIKGEYSFLISNRLDGIYNFVESSGISKDISQASNKINVNIENSKLKRDKASSKAYINSYAMLNYDQTFTENLINVIQNTDYGLYQARPKTAFDTVTVGKHSADETVAEYNSKLNVFKKELAIFENVVSSQEEHIRQVEKCNDLISNFEKEYIALTTVAREVVSEYYNDLNENYLTAKINKKGLITKSFIIKLGISFVLGAILVFVIAILASSLNDRRKARKKKKQIKKMKKKLRKGD